MIALSILSAAAFVPLAFAARDPPVFTLDCSTASGYPAACDTHCFAAVCSNSGTRTGNNFRDVAKYLHFAEDSSTTQPNLPKSQTSEADYRRNAIGCGSSDCTSRGVGLSCDEFPYASTYDGGLGCLTSRYTGADTIATSGVTHCAKLTDNTAHGRALKKFYDDKGLGNGSKFQIGFNEDNIDNAPACKVLREKGKAACSSLIATGLFKVVKSKPGPTTFCPDRPNLRRSNPERMTEEDVAEYEPRAVEWHSSVDAHGNKLLLPFSDGPLQAGTSIYHGIGNGTVFDSYVV